MTMRHLAAFLCALLLVPLGAAAQSPYSPAIMVNEDAISYYEIDQRLKMLELFNTPGNLPELAREQLIEERLKMQELRRFGLSLNEETLAEELQNFAGRADQTYEQFLGVLASNGIAEESLRDFVEVGVAWRDYIRSRYQGQSQVSDSEVQQGLNRMRGTGTQIEVLLNEIIVPAPAERAAEAQAVAERISRMRTTSAFEAAAREYSALPSREQGGRLDWLPIDNYPAQIRSIILDLSPGEVTRPLPIPNGIALFQLRAVREGAEAIEPPALIDYAVLFLPGAGTADGQADARRIAARADTCDDLYGLAANATPEQLQRHEVAPSEIPGDIALQLARLDANEASYGLTRGGSILLTMLCSRTPQLPEGASRETVTNALRSQRISGFADQRLAQLRAAAVIRRFE